MKYYCRGHGSFNMGWCFSRVMKWANEFKWSRESLEDDPCEGRSPTVSSHWQNLWHDNGRFVNHWVLHWYKNGYLKGNELYSSLHGNIFNLLGRKLLQFHMEQLEDNMWRGNFATFNIDPKRFLAVICHHVWDMDPLILVLYISMYVRTICVYKLSTS